MSLKSKIVHGPLQWSLACVIPEIFCPLVSCSLFALYKRLFGSSSKPQVINDASVRASAFTDHNRTSVRARTSMKVFTCEHTWTIEHFSYCDLRDPVVDYVESGKFSAPNNDKVWFHCSMYPRGYDTESEEHLSWFLHYECNDASVERMAVGYSLSVMNGRGNKYLTLDKKFVFEGQKDNWGIYQVISRDELTDPSNDLLPNGKLTLYCEVSYVTHYISTVDCEMSHINPALDLGSNLWNSRKFTDLVFTFADGSQLSAHKAVLVAQSSVFRAMFEHDMQESSSSCVQIAYIDAQTEEFNEMLRFIYTGQVENLDKLASHMLVLADKFQLDPLKTLCEQELCSRLGPSTAVSLYQLATTSSALHLQTQALEYLRKLPSTLVANPNLQLNPDFIDTMQNDPLCDKPSEHLVQTPGNNTLGTLFEKHEQNEDQEIEIAFHSEYTSDNEDNESISDHEACAFEVTSDFPWE